MSWPTVPGCLANELYSGAGSRQTSGTESFLHHPERNLSNNTSTGLPSTKLSASQEAQQVSDNSTMALFLRPNFALRPIKEAGKVTYLGESSTLATVVKDRHNMQDLFHFPLPENIRGVRASLTESDELEIEILRRRGAFLLPPTSLSDELVESYFQWVHPIIPIIDKAQFMRRYKSSKAPLPLLLLQAVFLTGSRVCSDSRLLGNDGSRIPAAMTFYKRAKALFDANYEEDRITIVQASILMSWFCEGPEGISILNLSRYLKAI